MGGHSEKAPQGYQPTGQGIADQNYQNLVAGATPWATNLPGSVIPGLQQVVSNVQNDPYFAGQMQGAQNVSNLATGTVAPMQGQAAQNLYNSAGATAATGQTALNAGQAAQNVGQNVSNWAGNMVGYGMGSGLSLADPFYQSGMAKANKVWNETQMAIPGMTGGMDAANAVLANGFDPQHALYDRNYQQNMDQTNAINAMYGVSGSPYGAGVAGQSSRNFNIDWQNNQLSRQLAALQGYGQQQTVVGNNFNNLLNTGAGQYGNLSQGAQSGYNNLMNDAVSRGSGLAALSGNAMNAGVAANMGAMNTNLNAQNAAAGLYGQASAGGSDMLNTLARGTALPNSTYLSSQDAQIAALQALASGGGASLAPTNNLIDANGNYMRIGQGATQLAQNAAQINNQAQAAQTQALMQGLGTIAGVAMAPMTGGMSLFGTAMQGMSAATGGAAALPTSAFGAFVSDRRLKRDVVRINTRPDGAGVYSFRYRRTGEHRIGVMAQEMLKVKPEAVIRMPGGYLAVDYARV